MALLKYNNIGISAIAACVPQKIEYNKDLGYMMTEEEMQKAIQNIGIEERRIAAPEVCASDLCYEAARKLMEDNAIDPATIDVLLFVSQTSDYHQPATAAILQHKLGLSKNVLAFDINLACSGYVYGLSTAYAYAQNEGVNRVLLLVGETMSKIVSRYDKVNTPLFGDAGTATLIEKGEFGRSLFSLHTDGKGAEVMMIPDGGFRNPVTQESFVEETDANGDKRTRLQFRMDGMAVFNFGMSEEPRDVKNIAPEDVRALLREMAAMEGLQVSGLMAVMPLTDDAAYLERLFRGMRALFEALRQEALDGIRMEELSMGMSGDYALAARCGATMVRVGSAIFGPRG